MDRPALWLCLIGACADPSPREVPDVEGEHVVIFTEPGLELCAGSLSHMDAFIARLAAEFGLDPPTGEERLRFHWITEDSVEEACGGVVAGCAPNGEIYSLHAPLDHELVHALVAPLGLPRSLFAEGLAIAYEGLGRRPQSPYSVDDSVTISELVEAGQVEFSSQGGYRIAGAYTAFLIDRFGIDAYLHAYASIGRGADRDSIDQVFRDVFGVPLAESILEFEELPSYAGTQCDQPQFTAKLMECSAPELTWDGTRLSVDRVIACEQDGSIGPFDDKVVVLHTITIPEQGYYELRMRGDEQEARELPDFTLGDQPVVGVSLQQCGGCDEWALMATWVGSTPRLAELPAGTYSLRLHGPAATSAALGCTLSRVDGP